MHMASEIDQPPAACKTDAACMPQNEEQYSCLRPLLCSEGSYRYYHEFTCFINRHLCMYCTKYTDSINYITF